MKLAKSNSSASQITRTYILILGLITIIMGLSLAIGVGYSLAASKVDDANGLMDSLQRSFIDDRPDWEQWRRNSNINTQDTHVRVSFNENNKQHIYYSPGTTKFLNQKTNYLPFNHNIEIRKLWRPYYHVQKTTKGIHYEIWVSFHSVTHIFHLIFDILLVVMLVSFLIGIWLIIILAKKLNQPLENLTASTHQINQAGQISYDTQLPIPEKPQEVKDLTNEFNQLLSQLNHQAIRDRQFVSDASHELRTPITAIRGHVQFIQRHGKEHPEIIEKSVGFIDSESKRMQKLIESLLRLSRMDNAKIKREKVDVSTIASAILETYQESFPQKLLLTGVSELSVLVNQDNLEQILIALLNNASKYSDKSSTITLNLTEHAIEVIDEGMGIPDADKSEIFERFYRVDKARTQKIPGTGLGLAIVKKLADLNQIQTKVEDNHPKGTKFILIFK